MKKTVGILDEIAEYGQRMAAAINTRKGSSLCATFISNPFEMKEKMADHQLQLLLVSEQYACEMEDASIPVYILVSDPVHGDTPGPGERVIYRYSRLTDIIEQLLSEAEKKTEEETGRLLVFFSPDSVEEAMKEAKRAAENLAKQGKTLFLPFDNFYGNTGKISITELLYTGLGSLGRLRELLINETSETYVSFGGPEHFSDLWQYTEEQMDSLLEVIKDSEYEYIVIGAGFMSDAVYRLFAGCDAVCIPNHSSARYHEFMRQMRASAGDEIAGKVREYS